MTEGTGIVGVSMENTGIRPSVPALLQVKGEVILTTCSVIYATGCKQNIQNQEM
jgi:hypothetical protein